ncbi:hypothetical protein Dimus_039105 [Dionaea muscipula]
MEAQDCATSSSSYFNPRSYQPSASHLPQSPAARCSPTTRSCRNRPPQPQPSSSTTRAAATIADYQSCRHYRRRPEPPPPSPPVIVAACRHHRRLEEEQRKPLSLMTMTMTMTGGGTTDLGQTMTMEGAAMAATLLLAADDESQRWRRHDR